MNWNPNLEATQSLRKIKRDYPNIITKYEGYYNKLKSEPYDIDTFESINDSMVYYQKMIAFYKSRVYRAKLELILRHKV